MNYIFLLIIVLFFFGAFLIYKVLFIPTPISKDEHLLSKELTETNGKTYFENSFCRKNEYGIYELYVEGSGYYRGIAIGKLLENITFEHEKEFIDSINSLVPNSYYLFFLKFLVGIFNRNLHQKIKQEYLEEIYGMAHFSSQSFEYIAPNYQRILNYHAAHDIGHALQNFGLVGCSSFVINASKSTDGSLLLARNLDFSPSEGFNKRKVIYFLNPKNGYKLVSYSWPGFSGVVSGMNEYGLCVVLHAAKSRTTLKSGTPVSLIAREILQYAKDLKETREILKSRHSFVAELFLVVSALDNTAIVFEKTPTSHTEFKLEGNQLLCANHYLSDEKKDSIKNIEWKKTISSDYREQRLSELLSQKAKVDVESAASILRDVRGLKDENIGLQNENAINQLAAHHGIIFKPSTKEFWISTSHYMMGEMIGYNFEEVFKKAKNKFKGKFNNEFSNISKDKFLDSEEYINFLEFKTLRNHLKHAINQKRELSNNMLSQFEYLNKNAFHSYELLGDYYKSQNNNLLAKTHYSKSLKLNIPTKFDYKRIENKLEKC